MDILFLELICWGGLIFLFWALADGLGKIEEEIEEFQEEQKKLANKPVKVPYVTPEKMEDPIGIYQGMHIYRYAIINGKRYLFDRVCPTGSRKEIALHECYITPGLVYQEYSEEQPTSLG